MPKRNLNESTLKFGIKESKNNEIVSFAICKSFESWFIVVVSRLRIKMMHQSHVVGCLIVFCALLQLGFAQAPGTTTTTPPPHPDARVVNGSLFKNTEVSFSLPIVSTVYVLNGEKLGDYLSRKFEVSLFHSFVYN